MLCSILPIKIIEETSFHHTKKEDTAYFSMKICACIVKSDLKGQSNLQKKKKTITGNALKNPVGGGKYLTIF